MQTSKQDRQTPSSQEILCFRDSLAELLQGIGFRFSDAYWHTETRPWNNPTDETSYHLIFESGALTLSFQIFDLTNYFVMLDIASKHMKESFELFNFCQVTDFPSFSMRNLRNKEYLSQYLVYLKTLFEDPPFHKILTGHFWFSFAFDMRDWATTPGLIPLIKANFLKALKSNE